MSPVEASCYLYKNLLLGPHSNRGDNMDADKTSVEICGAAKVTLAGAALAGFLLFAGTPSLRADDNCQKRISRADHRLHEAIEHHGRESRQAIMLASTPRSP